MRLEKAEKINFGSFRDFRWDPAVSEFGSVNILLGWNGSGKTTFSRILRGFENGIAVPGSQYKLKIDEITYTEASDLSTFEDSVRVFNDEYVNDVLAGNKTLPQVFYVGPEAVDYSKEEQELKEKNKVLKDKKCSNKHGEIAQTIAEAVRRVTGINSFQKELSDGNYSSYNKGDFERRVRDIKEKLEAKDIDNVSSYIQKDIQMLQNQLLNEVATKDIIQLIQRSAAWLDENYNEINSCLQATPQQEISKRIAELSLHQKEWVEEGVDIHFSGEEHLKKCLFCNSEIKNREELLKHFSGEVVKLTNKVMKFAEESKNLKTKLEERRDRANSQQAGSISKLGAIFDEITRKLQDKKNAITKEQDSIIDFDTDELLDYQTLPDANTIAHRIECHYVAEQYDKYLNLRTAYETCITERKVLEELVQQITERIKILKSQAQNTHQAAEKLKGIFKVAFPYRKIEISDNDDSTGYVLKRDGVECSFNGLSEGERNLIALAYFIASLNDENRNFSSDGIVVIDDPVSSLDKNSIFQIFALIAGEMKDHPSRQYFLLTHSLDFFGHLREHYRKKIDKSTYPIYNIILDEDGSKIKSIHKLLKNHRSDYYYVFSVLSNHKEACDVEDSYLIINLLRRWLETFLEFKFVSQGDFRGQIDSAYEEAKERKEDFRADPSEMYRFINHASHGFSDTETIDESVLNGASQRIQDAFQLVEALDSLHYKKLMNCIKQ